MNYKLRVTLQGIKGFYRVYSAGPEFSLYSLHKQMRSDMTFPSDQQILFKAFDAADNVVARYALFDLGNGTVDQISLAKAVKDGVDHFVYFYDTINKKSVNIQIEGTEDGSPCAPHVVDSKGPDPIDFENGYVAFEDLPEEKRRLPGEERPKSKLESLLGIDLDEDFDDEDEDDEEDEDEEDEEEEQIYDESEEL